MFQACSPLVTPSSNAIDTEENSGNPVKNHSDHSQPCGRPIGDVESARDFFNIVLDDLHCSEVDNKSNCRQKRGEDSPSNTNKGRKSCLTKGEPECDEESDKCDATGYWIQYERRSQPFVNGIFKILQVSIGRVLEMFRRRVYVHTISRPSVGQLSSPI